MESRILKFIEGAGEPLNAQQIATGIQQPATAVRLQLRTLAEAKKLKAVEVIGSVTRYALPDMIIKPADALPPPGEGRYPATEPRGTAGGRQGRTRPRQPCQGPGADARRQHPSRARHELEGSRAVAARARPPRQRLRPHGARQGGEGGC